MQNSLLEAPKESYMLDILFGPERSSARVTPPSRHAVYQTVDGRLYARAGDIKEVANELSEKLNQG